MTKNLRTIESPQVNTLVGDSAANATYRNHAGQDETVRNEFDPSQISFAAMLRLFRFHDPTTRNRQGSDIDARHLYHDAEQQLIAAELKIMSDSSDK